MNFREATGKQLKWVDTAIEKGFSNFLFTDQHYDSNPVLRRIFSLARKHGFKSLLIDEITESNCALLQAENAALACRRPDFQRSEVHRIAFLACPAQQAPGPGDFLGYVVFKRDFFASQPKPRAHVFESVTCPFRRADQNNFIHAGRHYEVNTSVGKFSIFGVIYAQQNSTTFVCAHVGLRSVLAAILPSGDITYGELNALAGIDHKTRQIKGGLEPEDMERILDGLKINYEKIVHEPSRNLLLPTEYQRDLYGAIESGFPALVGFELEAAGAPCGPRHIIPVFGHTFNEDTWLPDAQRAYFGGNLSYYPSESWLSTFVVHDDNFGPYLCLPRHFLKKDNFRLMYGLKSRPTALSAVQAEAVGFAFFNAIQSFRPHLGKDWYDRFSVFVARGWLVLRTMLLEKEQYLQHLEQMCSWQGAHLEQECIQKYRDYLPEAFWMIEASAPELFASSRRKFGEVLLPIDKAAPFNDSLMLAARLPGVIYIQPGKPPFEIMETKLDNHTDLFSLMQTKGGNR